MLSDADELVEVAVKPNYRALGKRFGKQTQQVADAIRAVDVAAFVAAYRAGTATVTLDGTELPISGDEVVVSETPRSGWAVASAGSDTVALDLELSHELRLAGLLREIVRLVQEGRKNGGLEVSDRIELWWRVGGSPDPAEAIRTHQDRFAAEVLATVGARGRAGLPGAGRGPRRRARPVGLGPPDLSKGGRPPLNPPPRAQRHPGSARSDAECGWVSRRTASPCCSSRRWP